MEKQPVTDSKPPDYSDVVGDTPYQYPMGAYPQYPAQAPPGSGPPQYAQQGPVPGYTQPPQPYMSGYTTHFGPNSAVVVQQPMLAPGGVPMAAPQDYMCAAIFVTLCCFWPTGIIAIMKANDSRVAMARNDVMSAHSSAKSAKTMINISIIVGIIAIILTAVIIGLYIGLVLSNLNSHYD
ncbi:proline-rich transmembrane protein 1-like [Gigantopelta aegis]|uniref:proline-rich transmembrane protein 1-like n=1 Tax=Gigantopelta aegis TaxID=1735272 RepID=UPI001B88BA81|nr:proline-rich transmembrane protein 1-like [Gigantopelta aegis]